MADVKWIKITTDMFEHEKLDFILSLPESDAIIIVWIRLLTLAGKVNAAGYVLLTENIAYTEEMLAHKFRKPLSVIKLALETLRRLKMIDFEGEAIRISNWERHQNVEGMEKVKEQNKIRSANYRARKKLNLLPEGNNHVTDHVTSDVSRDVTVTQSNATDIEVELDKEKDKNICVFKSYTSDPELIETLKEFVKFRKKIKSPMTDRAIELMLGQLNKLTNDDGEKVAILNQSIVNSWKGVFALKGGYAKPVKEENVMSLAEWQALEKRKKEEAAARMVNDL